MLTTLKQLWEILSPPERRKATFMLFLVAVMASIETAGVISIVPFLVAISQPEAIETNRILAWLYQHFGFSNRQDFIITLGLASAATIVFSSAFKTVTQHALNRFTHLQLHSISTRLLRNYLHQPYTFFLQRNTADLSKNMLSEGFARHRAASTIRPAQRQ